MLRQRATYDERGIWVQEHRPESSLAYTIWCADNDDGPSPLAVEWLLTAGVPAGPQEGGVLVPSDATIDVARDGSVTCDVALRDPITKEWRFTPDCRCITERQTFPSTTSLPLPDELLAIAGPHAP